MPKSSTKSKRLKLINFLRQAGPQVATVFAHLWAYFSDEFRGVGLRGLETSLVNRRQQPFELKRRVDDFDDICEVLTQLIEDQDAFEIAVAGFLKECDVRVAREEASLLPSSIETFGGQRCVVRHRRNYLAEILGETPAEDAEGVAAGPAYGNRGQGLSMFPYARRCVAIRLPEDGESLQLRFMKLSWEMELLFNQVAFDPEREYRVLLWSMPETEVRHAGLLNGDPSEIYNSLDTPQNESQIVASARAALDAAGKERATILVLPELTVSPGVEDAIRTYLSGKLQESKPLLTVFGRTHICDPERKRCDLNQGVVMNAYGEVICEHLKTVGFGALAPRKPISVLGRPRPNGVSERIETGTVFTLIETPLGVIVPMICKDLLNIQSERLIAQSNADTILLPSLSPQTKAHRDVAKRLRVQQWISTFVANRCLNCTWSNGRTSWHGRDGSPPESNALLGEGASFFCVPRPYGQPDLVVCGVNNPTIPYLVFTANLVAE